MAPHRAIPPKVAKGQEIPLPPAVQGASVGGLWMTDANFKSSIYLKNVVETSAVTITPILYLSNGVKYTLPNVTLEPAGTAIVDINAGLQSLGVASYATLSGYVEIDYNWPWDPICAMIRDVDVVHSLIFTYGLQASAPNKNSTAQTIEGLWWRHESNVTGFVALSNTSSQPLTAQVQVSDNEAAVLGTHTITISPNGTKTLSIQEMQSAAAEGGIRISYTGPQDSLAVNGGLEDQSVGYSAALRFSTFTVPVLPAGATLNTPVAIAELGLMVGVADPMMAFPAGTTFTPYSVLRNASSTAVSVTPTLWWMRAGVAASAQLPQLNFLPYETRSLDMTSLMAAAGLTNFNGSVNLVFDTGGKRLNLLMAAGSVDQTNTYVFEATPRSFAESVGMSMPYWSTGNGDDTMVTVWNPADEAQDFTFKIFFQGGQYNFPIHLDARATRTLNLSEAIQGQIPDTNGNIIPSTVHEGSMAIVGSQADNQHILVAVDGGVYNVRKATCQGETCTSCCGATSYSLAANPFGIIIGGQTQLNIAANWCTGQQYNLNSSSTWGSNNTGVATVQTGLTTGMNPGSATISATNNFEPVYVARICFNGSSPCPVGSGGGGSSAGTVSPTVTISGPQNIPMLKAGTVGSDSITLTASGSPSGGTYSWTAIAGQGNITILNATSQNAIVQSVAVGSYTVQVTYTVNGQPRTAVAVGMVQQPGSLGVISNTTPSFNCGNTGLPAYNTTDRLIQYQVLDTSSPAVPIPAVGMNASETNLSAISNTCNVNGPSPTLNAQTLSNGYFPNPDTLQLCSAQCLPANAQGGPSGSCSMVVAQTWSVNGYATKSDTITYTCLGPPTGAP